MPTPTTRYEPYDGRRDVLICRECSTRSTVFAINADERADHDDWHNEIGHMGYPDAMAALNE